MPEAETVLLLGSTGRTGGRVLRQLLDRGVHVRTIVRSAQRLPPAVAKHANLTLLEADLLSLTEDDLQQQLQGVRAVVSCLGHNITFRGLLGAPRDLVTQAVTRLCRAVIARGPQTPVKFVLMSSVSVHRPSGLDARRGWFERMFLWLVRSLLPPARDNQRAADFLLRSIGSNHPLLEWVAVRADSLVEGDVSAYALHEGIVDALFSPGTTSMANVAHFIAELLTCPATWQKWKYQLPVITDLPGTTA